MGSRTQPLAVESKVEVRVWSQRTQDGGKKNRNAPIDTAEIVSTHKMFSQRYCDGLNWKEGNRSVE